jgi:hypothetical protein
LADRLEGLIRAIEISAAQDEWAAVMNSVLHSRNDGEAANRREMNDPSMPCRAEGSPRARASLGNKTETERRESHQDYLSTYAVGANARVSTHDQQILPLQTRAMREYDIVAK